MLEQSLLERVRGLAVPERLELIGELWDTIDDGAVEVSPEVAALIDERIAQADADPGGSRPWREVRADLLGAPGASAS